MIRRLISLIRQHIYLVFLLKARHEFLNLLLIGQHLSRFAHLIDAFCTTGSSIIFTEAINRNLLGDRGFLLLFTFVHRIIRTRSSLCFTGFIEWIFRAVIRLKQTLGELGGHLFSVLGVAI